MQDWSVAYLGCSNEIYDIENSEKSIPEQIAHSSEELTPAAINSLEYIIGDLIGKELKSLKEASETIKEQKEDYITITNKE
jgi:hypothetical protein